MSVVNVIDTLTEWARVNVCEQIKLKVPPLEEAPDDASYEYERVTPAAFALYVPTSEKLPPNVRSPFPSLCVRFIKGEENTALNRGSMNVQFCFATWDTGLHGKDVFKPTEDNSFRRLSGAEAATFFERNGDGWRDAWNFVDIALRAVESVTNIGGYVVDKSFPIEYGPLVEQEAIPDFYPFWFAWISFRVNYSLFRNVEDFQTML